MILVRRGAISFAIAKYTFLTYRNVFMFSQRMRKPTKSQSTTQNVF